MSCFRANVGSCLDAELGDISLCSDFHRIACPLTYLELDCIYLLEYLSVVSLHDSESLPWVDWLESPVKLCRREDTLAAGIWPRGHQLAVQAAP